MSERSQEKLLSVIQLNILISFELATYIFICLLNHTMICEL